MRLPSWLTAAMIFSIVFGPLVAATWFWYSWPDRTIKTFIALAGQGRFEEANPLMVPLCSWIVDGNDLLVDIGSTRHRLLLSHHDRVSSGLPTLIVAIEPVSLLDRLIGRRRATLKGGAVELTAQLGKVSVRVDVERLSVQTVEMRLEEIRERVQKVHKDFEERMSKLDDELFKHLLKEGAGAVETNRGRVVGSESANPRP